MKKFAKSTLSLLLVLTMLMSICILPSMAEASSKDENNIYYFIGDSMSFNFVRKNNFLAPDYMTTYPDQVAAAMGLTVNEDLRLPGGRTTEAYALMSDYAGDDYFYERNFYKDNKVAYADRVAEADVLSLQLGYSSVSIYMLDNLSCVLNGEELKYSADLSQLFTGDELAKIMPYVSKCVKLVNSIVDKETQAAFVQYVNQLSDSQKEVLKSIFGEEFIETVNGAADKVSQLTDVLTYTIAAHCIHFDRTVDRIYELNPDVDLYVMGLTSPMDHLQFGFDLFGKTYTIPVNKLLSGIFDIMNAYMKVFSPYSTKYYFVDNVAHTPTFGEAMAKDADLTLDILYAYYNDFDEPGGRWDNHQYKNAEAYAKASSQASGVSQALANTMCINLSKVLADLPDDLSQINLSSGSEAFAKCTQLDENGKLTISYLDQLMVHIGMFGIMTGIYVHPTQEGHDMETPLLLAAMKDKQVDPLAVAYHKLAAPVESMVKALDKSTTIDSFIEWMNSIEQIWTDSTPDVDEGDDDIDTPDEPEVKPEAPEPTVLQKVGTVVKNVIQTISVTVSSVFSRLGKLFK